MQLFLVTSNRAIQSFFIAHFACCEKLSHPISGYLMKAPSNYHRQKLSLGPVLDKFVNKFLFPGFKKSQLPDYSRVPNRPHGWKKFTRLEKQQKHLANYKFSLAASQIPMAFMSGHISVALAPLSISFFQPCKFFPTVWSIWNSRVSQPWFLTIQLFKL